MSQTELEQKRIKQRRAFELLMWKIGTLECAPGQTVTMKLDQEKILETCAELPAAYDKEVTERICQHFDLHPSGSNGFKQTVKEIRAEMNPGKVKKVKPPEAKEVDYFELIESALGKTYKDIFSGKLLFWDEESWSSCWNELRRIKSLAYNLETEGVKAFRMAMIECYLAELEHRSQPQLIPALSLPEWDKIDRIAQVSDCLELDGSQASFDVLVVEELIKDWLCKMWQRFWNPGIRNRILILKGEQNIGKDYLLDVLCGALGQWNKNLTLTKNERDNLLQLTNSAVLKIAEFDRTSATDVGLLKHMVTAKNVDLRAAYAHDEKRYNCRCSFAASCNVDDIFRDSTGHTRYIVISLNGIIRKYPSSPQDSIQILAQAKYLANSNYKASQQTEEYLNAYLESRKPGTLDDDIVDSFNSYFADWWQHTNEDYLKRKIAERGWMTNPELMDADILTKVAKDCGTNVRVVQKKLKLRGLWKKSNSLKGYKINVPLDDGERDACTSDPLSFDSNKMKESRVDLFNDGTDDDVPF